MSKSSGKPMPIKKTPAVPAGGRMGQISITASSRKAPQPAKGKSSKESSTRDAGPK